MVGKLVGDVSFMYISVVSVRRKVSHSVLQEQLVNAIHLQLPQDMKLLVN